MDMEQRQIHEYPGELLWHKRGLDWYLDNDPQKLNKEFLDTLYEIKEIGGIIRNFEDIITDAYRIAVTVAFTEKYQNTDIAGILCDNYHDEMSLLYGCVILLSQEDGEDYEYTVNKIVELLRKKQNVKGLFVGSKVTYNWLVIRIFKLQRTNMNIDLSPDAGDLSSETQLWLIENLGLDIDELERVISFYRTKIGQLDFLHSFVKEYINYDHDDLQFCLSRKKGWILQFTISIDTYDWLENRVKQGLYLADEKDGLFSWSLLGEDPQAGTGIYDCENQKGQQENENNMGMLEKENKKLKQENKKLKQENKKLKQENKLLKEKNSEWEALYASGFASSAVVESDEGATVVNSDAARENEAYKKEIEEKEALINDLSNKLKNKSIPMSSIIDGFRKLARFDSREAVSMVFKSLGIMLSKCTAWTNSEDEILMIFAMDDNPAPGTVNHIYNSGANHYDHHRELTINNGDNKLLEKNKEETES